MKRCVLMVLLLMIVGVVNARFISLDAPPVHESPYMQICEITGYEKRVNTTITEAWYGEEEGNVEETIMKNRTVSETWIYWCGEY